MCVFVVTRIVYIRFSLIMLCGLFFFFFQAEDGIRDIGVTGVQTCALPICGSVRYSALHLLPLGILFASLEPMVAKYSLKAFAMTIELVKDLLSKIIYYLGFGIFFCFIVARP